VCHCVCHITIYTHTQTCIYKYIHNPTPNILHPQPESLSNHSAPRRRRRYEPRQQRRGRGRWLSCYSNTAPCSSSQRETSTCSRRHSTSRTTPRPARAPGTNPQKYCGTLHRIVTEHLKCTYALTFANFCAIPGQHNCTLHPRRASASSASRPASSPTTPTTPTARRTRAASLPRTPPSILRPSLHREHHSPHGVYAPYTPTSRPEVFLPSDTHLRSGAHSTTPRHKFSKVLSIVTRHQKFVTRHQKGTGALTCRLLSG
jgi:hypothetical protein